MPYLFKKIMQGGPVTKQKFLNLCYTNGITNLSKYKDVLQDQILKEYNVKCTPQCIRKVYAKIVKSTFNIGLGLYHTMMLEANLVRHMKDRHFDTIGEIDYELVYNEFKAKCWMSKWRSVKNFRESIQDRKLDGKLKLHFEGQIQANLLTPPIMSQKRPQVSVSNRKRWKKRKLIMEQQLKESANSSRWDNFVLETETDLRKTYQIINSELELWLPVWENHKHNGEDGMPGSPNIPGSIKGISIIKSILSNIGKKDILKMLGFNKPSTDDAGSGVNCFLKIIRILLNCACCGFEYKKMVGMFMKEYRHNDAIIHVPMIMRVLDAIREIDEKYSLYHQKLVCNEVFAIKFDKGWEATKSGNGSIVKTNFKKWLLSECRFKKSTAYRKGRIEIMFCEGWAEDDLQSLLMAYGDYNTSGVGIIFVANNPNRIYDTPTGKKKFDKPFFLKHLNKYVHSYKTLSADEMKFEQVRESFEIMAGGTQLTGYILARKCLVPDIKDHIAFEMEAMPSARPLSSLPPLDGAVKNEFYYYLSSNRFHAKHVFAAIQNKLTDNKDRKYFWGGYPDAAFCAQYLGSLESPLRFVEKAIEDHLKSWRMNYFLPENGDGIVSDRTLNDADQMYTEEQIQNDFLNGIDEIKQMMKQGQKYDLYMCRECGLKGTKDTLYNHLLSKFDECSCNSIAKYSLEETINVEDNTEDTLETTLRYSLADIENIKQTERKKIYSVVKKALVDNGITEKTDEAYEKEYLNRLSVNVSRDQAFKLSRGKKVLKNVRYVKDRFIVTFDDGYKIDLPIEEITPATDLVTKHRLLYYAKLPTQYQINGLKDNVYVHFLESVIYRTKMALNHPDRKHFYKILGGVLIISITLDGAPKGKHGQMSVITFTIGNECIKFTSADATPIMLTTSTESDGDTKLVCLELGALIKAFKDNVRRNGLSVTANDGRKVKFKKVVIVNSSDLAAQCKIDGWGGTGSEFPHACVIGLNHRSCGPLGSDFGRSKGIDLGNDASIINTFMRVWAPTTDPNAKWEKKGDRPIAILDCETRQRLFEAVEREMGRKYNDETDEDGRKNWLKEANDIARKHGHAQYKPPLFGSFICDLPSFCALHCKTTKVLDSLVNGASLMGLWDITNDNPIVNLGAQSAKLGPALSMYFALIETQPEYKNQLGMWCSDHSAKVLGNAAKRASRDINTDFKRLSKLLESLSEDAKLKTRLVGGMANVVLAKPWVYVEIQIKSFKKYPRAASREKKKFSFGISVLAVELFLLKEMMLYLSLTSYKKSEIKKFKNWYTIRAKQFEFVHSHFLPNVSRMYDIVMTCIVPLIFDQCIELGISPGGLGLLESKEKYHQKTVQCPSMPFTLEAATKLNRKSWCWQVVESLNLVGLYKETRPDTRTAYPSSEIRQVIREGNQNNRERGVGDEKGKMRQQRSYIYDPIETPYLQKKERCACGRFKTFDECTLCGWGDIKSIWEKSMKSGEILIRREKQASNGGESTSSTTTTTTTATSNEEEEIKSLMEYFSKMDKKNILRFLNVDFNKNDAS